jgi:capsular polysaccharide biosynthesis protein
VTGPIPFDDRYDEPDQLRDQLRRILRHRVLIAVGILVGVLGGLALSLLRAHTYTATSEVLVRSTTDPFGTVGVAADNQVSMTTEQRIAGSAAVAWRAARIQGRPDDQASSLAARVRVTNPLKSQVLRFEFTAQSPERAARGANAFAEAYLADRKSRNDAAVRRATRALEQQIGVLNERLNSNQLERATAKPATQNQLYNLQKRVLDIKSRDTDGGDVVRRATAPTLPVGPGLRTLLVIGLVCGLLLGIVLAWVRSALDNRVRSVGEVQTALRAPVLGILPSDDGGDEALLTVGRTRSPRTEAYRALAFRMRQADGAGGAGRVLVVAPRNAGDAEEVAANLSAALAEAGNDVLLMDTSPDTSGLATRLPLRPYEAPTLEEAFLPAGSVLVDAEVDGRFAFSSGGGDGPRYRTAFADPESSTVVVTGPLLTQADALAVAQRVDGILVVAGLNTTRRDDLRQVQELIGCSGGRLIGAVLDTGRPRRRLRLRGLRRRAKFGPVSQADTGSMELPTQDSTLSASRR